MPPGIKFTDQIRAEVIEHISQGKSLRTSCQLAGANYGTLWTWLYNGKRADAKPFHRSFFLAVQDAREKANGTIEEKITKRGMQRFVNGQLVSSYDLNSRFFEAVSTETQAYWLGFIAADGCVTGGKLRINLKDTDRGHLQKLLDSIESNHPIYDRISPGHTIKGRWCKPSSVCWISIGDAKLVTDLRSLGIEERKSLTAKPWRGPEHLMRHYWRGVVDGDGWLCKAQPRASGGFVWHIGLCGSESIVKAFTEFANAHIGSTRRPYHDKSGNLWRTSYTGDPKPRALAKLLYENSTVSLDRKASLALELITQPKVHTWSKNGRPELTLDVLTRLRAEYGSWKNVGKLFGLSVSGIFSILGRRRKRNLPA